VGGNVTMATVKGDIALTASEVVAEGDINIHAANNLTIQSGQDTAGNANTSNNKAIGTVVISDTERFGGYHAEKHRDDNDQVIQVPEHAPGRRDHHRWYLHAHELDKLLKADSACEKGSDAACSEAKELRELSNIRDRELIAACSGGVLARVQGLENGCSEGSGKYQ
jgi:hypothetical protein